MPRSQSTGIIATARATRVSFTSFTNQSISASVMAKARPKKRTTPRAPSRMSPTAFANPMMCTVCRSLAYFERSASRRPATSK